LPPRVSLRWNSALSTAESVSAAYARQSVPRWGVIVVRANETGRGSLFAALVAQRADRGREVGRGVHDCGHDDLVAAEGRHTSHRCADPPARGHQRVAGEMAETARFCGIGVLDEAMRWSTSPIAMPTCSPCRAWSSRNGSTRCRSAEQSGLFRLRGTCGVALEDMPS
jgi:hypothetical protein